MSLLLKDLSEMIGSESRSSWNFESCRQIEINPPLRIAVSYIDFDR